MSTARHHTAVTATQEPIVSTTTATTPLSRRGAGLRRVTALARLELTLLIRNRTALFNALALGPLMALFISSISIPGAETDDSTYVATLLASLLVFALVFAGYYNLCTTAVARREELMLKRLTTGELTRLEVLVAMAVPALSVILAQIVLGGIAIAVLVGRLPLVNPLLPLLGMLLGFVSMAGLGYATAAVTRSVESAQVTTLLPLAVLMLLSGSTVPLQVMPDGLRTVAELTPLAATHQLMSLGLTGTAADGTVVDLASSFGAAVQPTLVLLAWVAIGGYLALTRMPWEPRR